MAKHDLVIIGGGVWGTAAALAAVTAGLRDVVLLEANAGVAMESSAKSGGIVTDLLWNAEDFLWVQRSRQLMSEALDRTGDRSIISRLGLLTIAEPRHIDLLRQRADELSTRGVPFQFWDQDRVREEFPDLDRIKVPGLALWTPRDFHCNPTAFAESSLLGAKSLGLAARLGTKVERLEASGDQVVIHVEGESLTAERVLVTAGTWTAKLLERSGYTIPLRPYRVQMASLHLPDAYRLPMVWELATDAYVVPDGPHNLLAGDGTRLSEHDPDNYQTDGDGDFREFIASHIVDFTSKADAAGLRATWAGLAGATPDRRPLVGAVDDRVFVACGDQGMGIMRGPALGELALQVAIGEAEAPHLSPLRWPGRDFPIQPGFTLEETL